MTALRELATSYFAKLDSARAPLRQALVDGPLRNFADAPDIEERVALHIDGRSRFFINSILPWISAVRPLPGLDFIEIGPGTGSTTAPLAHVVRSVRAYDISNVSSDVARVRCRAMELDNVDVITVAPEVIYERLRSDHAGAPVSAVLMFAVLEHMKIEERLAALAAAWDVLEDGGLLVIGDTPNRLVYRHGHTSRLAFFDMTPDRLMLEYAEGSPNQGFADAVRDWRAGGASDGEITDRIDRWGRGVSFHELEIALGPLADKVLCDGFERPFSAAIPIGKEEALLMRYLNAELPHIPLGFARGVLYLILRKGKPVDVREKHWDERLTRALLAAV